MHECMPYPFLEPNGPVLLFSYETLAICMVVNISLATYTLQEIYKYMYKAFIVEELLKVVCNDKSPMNLIA